MFLAVCTENRCPRDRRLIESCDRPAGRKRSPGGPRGVSLPAFGISRRRAGVDPCERAGLHRVRGMVESRIAGFYRWPLERRREHLAQLLGRPPGALTALDPEALSLELADKL